MAKALEILAMNLKRLRGQITQRELAKKAGINVEVIRGIEQTRTWPEQANIARLASALGVEESDLFMLGVGDSAIEIAKKEKDWRDIHPVDAMLRVKAWLEQLDEADLSDPAFREFVDALSKK